MLICFFCISLSAQTKKTLQKQEAEQILLAPCGSAGNFSVNAFVTPPPCCAQFTAPNDGQYSDVSWDFGDGSTSSDPTSVYHCYAQSGNYTVKHTVILYDGTPCWKTRSVSITNCDPCPELLNIAVAQNGNVPPLPDVCGPSNFKNNSDLPEAQNYCMFKFTPVLNSSSNAGMTFFWEMFWIDPNTFSYTLACSATAPAFRVEFGQNNNSKFFGVKVTATKLNCPTQITGKFVLVPDITCNYFTFLKAPTNGSTESIHLKKMMTNQGKGVSVYPNPVDNLLRISNLKDAEDYTFDIQNTLGQTILSQKISSTDTSINVSNLMTGVYIGVIRSQGKIISTTKVYKK
jgi:PKD repeat protein